MHVKILQKKWIRWKCVARKFGFDYLRFDPLRRYSKTDFTTIDTLGWLDGAEVTHHLWVYEFPGSIPGSGNGFYVSFFLFYCCCFYFLSKTRNLSHHFAIPFAMFIYLVYLTYCKIWDRLWGYKDTDLSFLRYSLIDSDLSFLRYSLIDTDLSFLRYSLNYNK